MSVDPHLQEVGSRLEPLMLVLGQLLFAAAVLEKALLVDLIQRRVIRDGAEEVFGARLVSRLETKTAGALLVELQPLEYDEALAAELVDVIDRRNHFVHHLFDDADLFGAMTDDGGFGRLAARVEALTGDIFSVVSKLEPGVTEGMSKIFGSPRQILASVRQLDPTTIEDDEVRRQLEAMQALPDDFIGR